MRNMNIDKQNLNKSPGVQISNNATTSYHTQILKNMVHPYYSPRTLYDILYQYIANNQYIKIQGKPITNQNFKINLDNLKVHHLVN